MKETEMDKLIDAVIEVSTRISSLENKVSDRLESMDTKLESMDSKLETMNTKLDKHEKQLAKLDKHAVTTNLSIIELRHSIEQIETKRFDDLNKRVTKLEKTML